MRKRKIREAVVVLILLLLSFLTWRHIPLLQFQGEGFYYFAKIAPQISFSFPLQYDVFGIFMFNVLDPYIGDRTDLYMWILFVVMLLIDFTVYVLVRVVTGSKLAAFLTTLLFAVSYVGKYEMYSSGGYQYFVQRAILLLPQLLSLSFLALYLKRDRVGYYLVSLPLYTLSIAMGFFGTYSLPIFIFYPVFMLMFSPPSRNPRVENPRMKRSKFASAGRQTSQPRLTVADFRSEGARTKNPRALSHRSFNKLSKISCNPKILLMLLPYIIVSIILVRRNAYFNQDQSFLGFLIYEQKVIPGLFQQLGVLTLPLGWYQSIANFLVDFTFETITGDIAAYTIGFFLVLLYAIGILAIWKLSPNLIAIALAGLAWLITMLLFNLYLNSGSVLAAFSSSRYFYFPSLAFSLFWGSILASIFSKGRLTPKILIPLFSVLWMAYNNIVVQRYLAIDGLKHRINKQIIQTVRAWAPDLKRQPSYLLIPSAIGSYGAEFVYRYYSHPEGKVALVHQEGPDFNKLVEQTAPDRLYVLQLDLTTDVLADETERSRVLLKKLKER